MQYSFEKIDLKDFLLDYIIEVQKLKNKQFL